MGSNKIKIRLVVKHIDDKMDEVKTNTERPSYVALNKLRNIFENIEKREEEVESDRVMLLLNTAKQSEDVLAAGFAEADLDEPFDEQMRVVSSVEDIIKLLTNH